MSMGLFTMTTKNGEVVGGIVFGEGDLALCTQRFCAESEGRMLNGIAIGVCSIPPQDLGTAIPEEVHPFNTPDTVPDFLLAFTNVRSVDGLLEVLAVVRARLVAGDADSPGSTEGGADAGR